MVEKNTIHVSRSNNCKSARTIGHNRAACQNRKMCYLEETFHVICGHWGAKRNVSPCAIAHEIKGFSKGCWNAKTIGAARMNTRCASCHRMETVKSQRAWESHKDGQAEARMLLKMRYYSRRLAFRKDYPWLPRPDPMGLERSRSFPGAHR